jgi:hypothetical protein
MSTQDQVDALRAMADGLEAVAAAEAKAAKAKAAYRESPTAKNKAAHRAAAQALVEVRQAVRGNDKPRAVAPGDVSITPATVSAQGA